MTAKNNYFQKNLKYLRKKYGDTQESLAKYLGKRSLTSVSDWERGKSIPYARTLTKIANKYHVTIDELMDVDLENRPANVKVIRTVQARRIPVIGEIACGEPITADQNITDYQLVIDDGLPGGDLFFLDCKGDSMEPVIKDGSRVLCRFQEDVENGEIAAVQLNGDTEATLKRVIKQDGKIVLEPINPYYPSYPVDEDHPIRVVGKAIEVINKL